MVPLSSVVAWSSTHPWPTRRQTDTTSTRPPHSLSNPCCPRLIERQSCNASLKHRAAGFLGVLKLFKIVRVGYARTHANDRSWRYLASRTMSTARTTRVRALRTSGSALAAVIRSVPYSISLLAATSSLSARFAVVASGR